MKLIRAGAVVLLLYIGASGIAAWFFEPDETAATGRGAFIGLIPDHSLPFNIDSELLSPDGTAQVGDGDAVKAPSFISITVPQGDGCHFVAVRADAEKKAVEFVPALPPERADARSALPRSDDERPACSLVVTVGEQDYTLQKTRTLRLVLGTDAPPRTLFEPKPVASVQGSFNDLSGEFASLAGSRKPHAVEIASRRIKLSVVASKQGGDLQFTMDTDSPDRLEIDGHGRWRWFFSRWWRFLKEGKLLFDLVHKGVSGG